MSNLRTKCPRSEWPLIKAKIHKIYFALNERDARENARAFIKLYFDTFLLTSKSEPKKMGKIGAKVPIPGGNVVPRYRQPGKVLKKEGNPKP